MLSIQLANCLLPRCLFCANSQTSTCLMSSDCRDAQYNHKREFRDLSQLPHDGTVFASFRSARNFRVVLRIGNYTFTPVYTLLAEPRLLGRGEGHWFLRNVWLRNLEPRWTKLLATSQIIWTTLHSCSYLRGSYSWWNQFSIAVRFSGYPLSEVLNVLFRDKPTRSYSTKIKVYNLKVTQSMDFPWVFPLLTSCINLCVCAKGWELQWIRLIPLPHLLHEAVLLSCRVSWSTSLKCKHWNGHSHYAMLCHCCTRDVVCGVLCNWCTCWPTLSF